MRVGGKPISLSARDRKTLEEWVDRPGVPLKFIIRAWIVLLSAAGQPTAGIASRLGVSQSTVLLWLNRFRQGGVRQIAEEKKIERPRRGDEDVRKIVEATMNEFPEKARRWSIRNMARFTGISRSTIQRIWKRYGLSPQSEEFKFRHDPDFYESCRDLAGVYLESRNVFAIALLTTDVDGSRPANTAPFQPNPGLWTKVLRVLHQNPERRQPKAGLVGFLKRLDTHTPPETILHLIVPRQAAAIYPQAFRWLKRHPRFQQHILPKGVSSREFLSEWYARTCDASKSRRTFSQLPDLQSELEEFISDPSPANSRKILLAKIFTWNRPDRNYQSNESQLELNLSAG